MKFIIDHSLRDWYKCLVWWIGLPYKEREEYKGDNKYLSLEDIFQKYISSHV